MKVMRKKLMRWPAAGMALCLTLGLPQDTPVFEDIVPYPLYIRSHRSEDPQ